MVRLYVIDDHCLIFDGFCFSFEAGSDDFKVTGGSQCVDEALSKISPAEVDIIILDLFINQTDPVENITRLHKSFPTIPIVILSQEFSLRWRIEMFRHGAKAYLNKTDDKKIIEDRLLQVAAGEVVMPDDVARVLVNSTDQKSGTPLLPSDYLTIISYLANGMTIKMIAKRLRQSDSNIEKKLCYLRSYFNASTNTQLVYKVFTRQIPDLDF